MTPRSLLPFLAGGLCALSVAVSQPLFAQNFANGTHGVNGAALTPSPDDLQPWRQGPHDKSLFLQVRDGTLTVDGMTAKVHLNYDVKDQPYLYVFMPGEGTAVLSQVAMADSVLVKDAIRDQRLEFTAGGHDFKLESTSPLVVNATKEYKAGKDARVNLYVRFDRSATMLARAPMFGYGTTVRAPFNWPYSRPQSDLSEHHTYTVPPLPASVLPRVQQVSLATNGR